MALQDKKGALLCALLAIPCTILGKTYPTIGAPIFAILLGICIALFYRPSAAMQVGITWTSKKILQWAVIFLGFGLSFKDVFEVGITSLPVIISTISISLIIMGIAMKLTSIQKDVALMIGIGSSICGGSAIAATASVLKPKSNDISQAMAVVFLFNVMAALTFPTLGEMLHMSHNGFALFAGTAINDTSSVTAAATVWEDMHHVTGTLADATIVKLTRTLAIIPIVMVLAYVTHRATAAPTERKPLYQLLPNFITGFLIAIGITTVVSFMGITTEIFIYFKEVSKFFITMAMLAIGLQTELVKLIKNGQKGILLGGACWLSISLVSLIMQYLLGLL